MDDVTFDSHEISYDAQPLTEGTVYVISFAVAAFDEPEQTGGESFF